MTVLEILVGWVASPVVFVLPISKPVSLTQSFHGSSNLGGNWELVLPVAVNVKILLAAVTKAIAPLDLAYGWS